MQRLAAALVAAMGSLVLLPACAGPEVDDSPVHARKDSGSHTTSDAGADTTADTSSADTGASEDTDVDTGTEDTRVEPVDTGTGDPCSDCVNTACKVQLAACLADTECNAQMECLSKCWDEACADACAAAHPSTKVAPFLSCVSVKCSVPCGGP